MVCPMPLSIISDEPYQFLPHLRPLERAITIIYGLLPVTVPERQQLHQRLLHSASRTVIHRKMQHRRAVPARPSANSNFAANHREGPRTVKTLLAVHRDKPPPSSSSHRSSRLCALRSSSSHCQPPPSSTTTTSSLFLLLRVHPRRRRCHSQRAASTSHLRFQPQRRCQPLPSLLR
ncbi:hypothetical protein SESBI_36692 [Sesbania bispinosa]|nr:hypothetical protein SESBI_36692 [Sesbania bispinosa]